MATTTTTTSNDSIPTLPFVPLAEGNVHLRRHPHTAQHQLAVVGRQLAPFLLLSRRSSSVSPSLDAERRRTLRGLYRTLWEERKEVPTFLLREWLDNALAVAEALGESGAALAWLLDSNHNSITENEVEKGEVEGADDTPKKQRKEEGEKEEQVEEESHDECAPHASHNEGKKRKAKEAQTRKKWSLWFASKHKSNTVHYMTLRTFLLPDNNNNNNHNTAIYCISASDIENMDTAAFHRRVHMYLRCGEVYSHGREQGSEQQEQNKEKEGEYNMYEGLESLAGPTASKINDDETQQLISLLLSRPPSTALHLVGAVRYRVVSEVVLLRLSSATPRCTLTWRLLASCCHYLAQGNKHTLMNKIDALVLQAVAHYIERHLVPYLELRDRGLNATTIVSFSLLAAVWNEPSHQYGVLDMVLPPSCSSTTTSSTTTTTTLREVLKQEQTEEEEEVGGAERHQYSERIYEAIRRGCGWALDADNKEESDDTAVQTLLAMLLLGSPEHEPKEAKDLLLQYGSEPHRSAWLQFIRQFLLRTPMEAFERRNSSA